MITSWQLLKIQVFLSGLHEPRPSWFSAMRVGPFKRVSAEALKPFNVFSHANTCTREKTFNNISKALLMLLPTFVLKLFHFIYLELKNAREYGWILRTFKNT